jgi:hypothetical protein
MPKRFVYVLRNAEIPSRYYTGVTSNMARRHAEHNAGGCIHTAKFDYEVANRSRRPDYRLRTTPVVFCEVKDFTFAPRQIGWSGR